MKPNALVTGAASGIGLALVKAMGERGFRVTMTDRDAAKLESASAPLRRMGMDVHCCVMDVTDRDVVRAVVERCAREHGRLDYLFNNAGVGIAGELRDMRIEDWRHIIEVNLFGVIHGVEAAYPLMIEQGSGHIVNIASIAGLIPLPGESVYVASKHAVVGLTQTLRAEAAGYGVDVSLVCPGVVKTPIYESSPVVGFDKAKALALWPDGIRPEVCAREILKGVDRKKGTIVVTPLAQLLWGVQRMSPGLFLRGAVGYMKRLRQTREG